MPLPEVRTKHDFVHRYEAGEFGNHSPTWPFPNTEWVHWASQWNASQLYHIRNRVAGGPTYYDVPPWDVAYSWSVLEGRGVARSSLYLSAMCPTHRTLINGEVKQYDPTDPFGPEHGGLDLYYSTVAKPMRPSLAEGGKRVIGPGARLVLNHFLNQRSLDWMEHLLEAYPGHTIEFTALDCCWGTEPGHNTLVWEVRKY